MEDLKALYWDPNRTASYNALFNFIVGSRGAGKTYGILNRGDVAMWGAVILAGNAVGLYSDLRQTAIDHVHVEKEFTPHEEQSVIYDKHAALYKAYFHELQGFYERVQALG